MSRGTTGAARRAPRLTRLGAVAAISLLSAAGAGEAMAAPGASHPPSQVSSLINQIAGANQNIADLDGAVAARQEAANRAIADYQNSLAAQQVASVAASGAQKSLTGASKATAAAQKRFDAFVRSVYRHGTNQNSMSNYVSSPDPQRVLDRMATVDRLADNQKATIRKLQVARNQEANRAAALEATKRQATLAAQGAQTRRSSAISSVSEARTAMAAEKQRRTALVQQRDSVQARLDALRGGPARKHASAPATPAAPKDLLSNLFRGPGAPPVPQPTPAAGGDNDALAVAAEAAGRLALDVSQKVLAGVVGQQQVPHSQLLDELGLGGAGLGSADSGRGNSGGDTLSSRLGSGSLGSLFGSSSGGGAGGGGGPVQPGLRGPKAVEIVVNRALSQLNVTYAWGGGDATGPTQGIHDGGVADSYGDYNKIGYDCSGLMMYAFAGVGVQLPHYTGYQYTSGPHVPLSQMQRGDMIFYGPNASEHVALYIGDDKMVEAPQSGDVVKVSPVRTAGAMPSVVRLL